MWCAVCGELGSGSSVEEGQGFGGGGEAEHEPVPRFTEALNAFETTRVFVYADDVTEIDQANLISIECSLFNLKRTHSTKQTFIKRSNAKWTLQWTQ